MSESQDSQRLHTATDNHLRWLKEYGTMILKRLHKINHNFCHKSAADQVEKFFFAHFLKKNIGEIFTQCVEKR